MFVFGLFVFYFSLYSSKRKPDKFRHVNLFPTNLGNCKFLFTTTSNEVTGNVVNAFTKLEIK